MDICDVVFFYDNNKFFRQFAIYKNNSFYYLSNDFPDWFKLKVLNEKETLSIYNCNLKKVLTKPK